jgi:hypothetical protein
VTGFRGLGQIVTSGAGTVDVLHRLALVVQPVDGVDGRPIRGVDGLRVGRERGRPPSGRALNPLVAYSPAAADGGGRYILRHGGTVGATVRIRLDDPRRRWVPRRLDIALWTLGEVAVADEPAPERPVGVSYIPPARRLVQPSLMPGPAYRCPPGTTGLRLRAVHGGMPVPWVRADVFDVGGLVSWAHGDDNGELLVVLPIPPGTPLPADGRLVVRLHRPDPDWADEQHWAAVPEPADPLAGLHPEPVPRRDPDPLADVEAGRTVPPGYLETTTDHVVELTAGQVVTWPDLDID